MFNKVLSLAVVGWLFAMAPSFVLAAGIAPSAPTNVTATAGNGSATVSFTPGSIGSGTLVKYWAACGIDNTHLIIATGSNSPITVTGLTNGTVYYCWALTESTVGYSSNWSTVSNPVTPTAATVPVPATGKAIEFCNANINHYFMTASIDEAAFLDSKPSWGWARTGKTFDIWLTQASAPGNASPVCRFYGLFANGTVGSHFYTVDPAECEMVKGRLDWGWGYENNAFYAVKPFGISCQSGTSPVYRAFNNGMGGAPNHRYMTNQTDVDTMVSQGWVSEGVAMCAASGTSSGGATSCGAAPSPSMSTGAATVLTTSSVSTSGGTVTVNNGNLNGLVLTVPAGAYTTSREFKISSAPVNSHTFGNMFNPISPLITVENGGGYSEEIITVKVPVNIPAGYFAMGFYYNEDTKKLEGMPTVAQDSNSITVATRHFSKFIITLIADSLLNRDIETQFRPGIDDWQFSNYGSFIAPGGHCAGQSVSAMWYFYEQPDGKDRTLSGRYDNNGNQPPTPGLWVDDSLGYRLASVVQRDLNWDNLLTKFTRDYVSMSDSLTWRSFAYSMQLTGQPQYVSVYSTTKKAGHALVAYRMANGQIYVSDPNKPGNTERRIDYANETFGIYNSAQKADDINNTPYDHIRYVAKTAFVDWNKMTARWAEMKNGTIGNDQFPAYSLVRKADDGTWKALPDGYVSSKKLIYINWETDIDGESYIYRDGARLPYDAAYNIELKPGTNKLGIYVQGLYVDSAGNPVLDEKGNRQYKYIDFKSLDVVYSPPIDCINDPYSGLCWDTKLETGTNWFGMNWAAAFSYCSGKGARLPTIEELVLFATEGKAHFNGIKSSYYIFGAAVNLKASLEARGFDFGTGADESWSSTPISVFTEWGWSVTFASGYVDTSMDSERLYVRCVK